MSTVLGTVGNDTITGSFTSEGVIGGLTPGQDSVFGREGDDSIIGNEGADWLFGEAGADTLVAGGGNGADTLDGGSGSDSLAGDSLNNWIGAGLGSDTVAGLDGNDTLDGGGHNSSDVSDVSSWFFSGDWVDYSDSGGAVTVSFFDLTVGARGSAIGAAGNDSLIGFERVIGSDFNDSLSGGYTSWLEGGLGNDTIIGPDPSRNLPTFASYSQATSGVTVDLGAGTSDGAHGQDSLVRITGIIGGRGDDRLIGSLTPMRNTFNITDRNQEFIGGLGNDTIIAADSGRLMSTAWYERATGSVTVDLVAGTTAGAEGNDSLININTVRMGVHNDLIVAGAGHWVMGGRGDDTIIDTSGSAVYGATGLGNVTVDLNLGFAASGNGTDSLFGIQNVQISGLDSGGPNSLLGNSSANNLFINSGEGTIDGAGGNDTLWSGRGNESLSGGEGDDWASFARQNNTPDRAVTVDLGAGTATGAGTVATIEFRFGNDTLTGIEGVLGGDLADSMMGSARNETLAGSGGNDTLNGGMGNDWVSYAEAPFVMGISSGQPAASGAVTVDLVAGTSHGGHGNDILTGFEAVIGSAGRDSILGDGGANTLMGAAGNDTLAGGAGTDWASYASATGAVTVDLGAGTSSGADGADVMTGIEAVRGGAGNDSLLGNSGNNILAGDAGNDTLASGDGDDTVIGGPGDDNLDGGVGNDLLSYAGATGGVTVDMEAGRATASSDTISGFESVQGSGFNDGLVGDDSANGLYGEDGNDTISAGGGNDTVLGGDGADSLAGGDGADSIFGGEGVDVLSGGTGNDWLDFGADNDSFSYQTSDGFGNETLVGGDGFDVLDLGIGWRSGPVAAGWINYQRGNDNTVIYTKGWDSVVCFVEGTRVMTPSGEDAVENLRAGDMVLAMRGGETGFEPLRWVGSMDVAVPRDAAMAAKTAPILIKAGALAEGLPARDLRVSPDHAIEVDGYLIPAKHLVNGASIVQEAWCQRVTYFHLELEAHGLLLSEGLWSESYLDDGNRDAFNNRALTGLFLDFEAGRSKGQYDAQACLPVLRDGLQLDLIHGRIAIRAEELKLAKKARGR